MNRYDEETHINVGTEEDLTIADLAQLIRDIVHSSAVVTFDSSKPDGAPRKLLDVSRFHPSRVAAQNRLANGHRADLSLVPGK
jgi:GDP-L-fucose synthase